jgi:hypothetical protein
LKNFEELIKYQDGIRFQIQNTILKELDQIYNLNVTASFFDLSIKSNDCLKYKTFCKTLKQKKSTKTVSDFKFKIRFWKNSTRSTIWTYPHLFWIFQSRAMTVKSKILFIKLWSNKKVPRRYQISNSKYDSERARPDLQFKRYRIFFRSFNQEQWLFKV